MQRALRMSLRAPMDDAFKSAGFAMAKMIAATSQTRETTAREPPVHPIPILIAATVAYRINGAAMETSIARTD